jgi:replicative DNA helicase
MTIELLIPPHSIEAEHSLLGGLMIDNSAWDRVSDLIKAEHFYRDDHRRIFRHIHHLIVAGKPADVVTVFESIERSNEVDQTGGLSYLGEIANNTPSAANIFHYAEIIADYALIRSMLAVGDEIANNAARPAGRSARELIDIAERKMQEISNLAARAHASGPVPIQDVASAVVERIENRLAQDKANALTGIESGFADIDAMTDGFQPGDLIVLAARPSMGKTALALNIAEHVGIKLRLPTAIFSLEMGGEQLAQRIISATGGIDSQALRRAHLTDDQWDGLTVALGKIHEAPIFIDETCDITPIELRSRARRLAREHGKLGLIVIDYLQLMSTGRGGSETRANELGDITRQLKALAKELHVPVIALSQLSRKVEERTDKRPIMSDLRESGAIEQDADLILMMYRDEYYKPDSEWKGVAEVILGKNRNGPTGMARLTFQGEFTRFRNYTPSAY